MPSRTEYLESLTPGPPPQTAAAEDCPICTEPLTADIVTAHAAHAFHHECLLQWLTASDQHSHYRRHCPMCRFELFTTESAVAGMPTPFRHGPYDSSGAELRRWLNRIYRSPTLASFDVLNTGAEPEGYMPLPLLGMWVAAGDADARLDAEIHAGGIEWRYSRARVGAPGEAASWVDAVEEFGRFREDFFREHPTGKRAVQYRLPAERPPAWLPLSEYGAWALAWDDEERVVVETRARKVKEVYDRLVSEGEEL